MAALQRSSCIVMLLVSRCISGQSLGAAQAAARAGRVDAALAALQAMPASASADALRCRLYGSVDQRERAVTACEAAAAAAPANSNYVLELARAYGAKAAAGNVLTGMRMVGKIRGNFERAVQLDGRNVEALSDLGQFYVEAPGVAGGGLDKARALLPQLQALPSARGHRLAAMIAAKGKNDAEAEQEFTAELNASHSPEAYVDLANFFKARKAWDQAASNAKLAIEHDTHHGPDTLDAAEVLIDLKRDAPVAQAALRSYLKQPQEPVARYARAHVLLGRSLRAGGDAAGARAEYQAALDLAHDYEAARQGLAP